MLKIRSVRFQHIEPVVPHSGGHRGHLVLQNEGWLQLMELYLRKPYLVGARAVIVPREILNLRRQVGVTRRIIHIDVILLTELINLNPNIVTQISLLKIQMGLVLKVDLPILVLLQVLLLSALNDV